MSQIIAPKKASSKTTDRKNSSTSAKSGTTNFSIKPITAATLKGVKTHCLLLPVYDEKSLPTLTRAIDKASGGAISALIKLGDFSGKAEKTALLPCPQIPGIDRIILFGCGPKADLTTMLLQKCVHQAVTLLLSTEASNAAFAMSDIETKDAYRIISQTVSLNLYKFTQLKSSKPKSKPLKRVTLLGSGTAKQRASAKTSLLEGAAIGSGANFTRSLGDLPGNICTPNYLAEESKKLARSHSQLSCKVIKESELKKMGAGAFISVSQGSDQPGAMIILEYKGSKKKSDAPHVLVGKGITFDTGGISLKSPGKMDEMKYDMCGAATVLGVIQAVTQLNLPLNVIGVIAAAENMPSARATRPGDIVTTLSGQTVEILNTDAEGRLVLCDALTYVKRYKPASVIDIATLTGACIVALGSHASGLMGNNSDLNKQLLKAGERALDRAWQLPLWPEYTKQLDSEFADFANVGAQGAGTVTAACFLSKFTKEYDWAHLDIAGTAWRSGGKGKGASGRPVPLLTQYLINRAHHDR